MLRRNWKLLLILALLAPPLLFCASIPLALRGLLDLHPEPISDTKDLPDVLLQAFKDDALLRSAFDVWQIEPLPDRKCIWVISDNASYVERFIFTNKLIHTRFSHPRIKLLSSCLRPEWEKPDDNAWDWYTTERYGEEHLEGQDLFLVGWKKDHSRAIVLYEWIF